MLRGAMSHSILLLSFDLPKQSIQHRLGVFLIERRISRFKHRGEHAA